jgi:hypothetical protein
MLCARVIPVWADRVAHTRNLQCFPHTCTVNGPARVGLHADANAEVARVRIVAWSACAGQLQPCPAALQPHKRIVCARALVPVCVRVQGVRARVDTGHTQLSGHTLVCVCALCNHIGQIDNGPALYRRG